MARANPLEFLQQVRTETSKVVWPSRRETFITATMVVVMAVTASVFFLFADQVISKIVTYLIALGH